MDKSVCAFYLNDGRNDVRPQYNKYSQDDSISIENAQQRRVTLY